MKHSARHVVAIAMAFTLLMTGTALAHPDHEVEASEEGALPYSEDSHNKNDDDDEGAHLPPVQENVELVGKAEVTNPGVDESGTALSNDGRVADVFPYDHPGLPEGQRSFAYLAAFLEPTCENTGVHVININDLANPFEEVEAFVPTNDGNYVGEGVQVIRIGDRDVLIFNNETCAGTESEGPFGGISLFDVTDPLNATPLSEHFGDTSTAEGEEDVPEGSAHTVHSMFAWTNDEGRTFAVLVDNDEETDVDIADISDPENPVIINDTLDLGVEPFDVDQSSPDNLTSVFSHDFNVTRAPDGRFIMTVNYWDGGYVLLDVTDPVNVEMIQETDFEALDPERLERADQEIAPEGNAHQSEVAPDFNFLVGTDEDFAPFRLLATLEDGTDIQVGTGSDNSTPEAGATFSAEELTFVGLACEPLDESLNATEEGQVGLAERGGCTFSTKVQNLQDAGYDTAVVVNSSAPGNCSTVINMSTPGEDIEIPSYFIGRDTGFALFGAEYDEAACQEGGQPFAAEPGEVSDSGFSADSVFEGWGYVRLYDVDLEGGGRIVREPIDTYAVDESQDEEFAVGFGDLSVHEVAIDPRFSPTEDGTGLAYLSYYSAGFRVIQYGPEGIQEVGAFIDEEGSNLWGVEYYERDGEPFIMTSDRDFGLYIFNYTGDEPGGEPAPEPEPEPEPEPQPLPDAVTRLSGPGRVETSLEISRAGFADGAAGAVVLARSDLFPDALAGSPLAITEDAPLLLTSSEGLDDAVADEIERVLASGGTVYLLGGTAALSQQVEDDVTALGFEAERFGGFNRFATARIIAEDGLDSPDTVLLANGRDFPDAVSAGAAGGVANAAVLLTGVDQPDPETDAYLAAGNRTTYAVGGPAAAAYPNAEPLFGATRFETAVLVAQEFFDAPAVAGFATGESFADALAGGAFVGRLGGPLLLTGRDQLPELTENYLEAEAGNIEEGFVFGGTDVISDEVADQAVAAYNPDGGATPDESQGPGN